MKKITSIAAALFMATAFCGVCAGCASEISANSESKNDAPPVASVTTDEQHKVILCPGSYYSGNNVTPNAVGTGATKLAAADEEAYFVTNAYFATVAAGEDLPAATTGRAKTTFQGWTYAKDGIVETVAKMPASLDDDLYLYASWKTEGNIQVDPGTDPDDPGTDPTPGESYVQVGAQKYTLTRNTGNTAREEYWLGGTKIDLAVGNTISLYMNGQKISAYLEPTSSGIAAGDSSTAHDTFTVNMAGSFEMYLHKNANDWSVEFVVTTPVSEVTVSIPSNAVRSEITFKNGKVTVYIKNGNNFATSFTGYKLYMWNGSTEYFGAWNSVPAMSASMSAAQYDLTADVCFILRKDSGQTRNLSGMEVGGTYLITYASGDAAKVEKIRVA